MPLSVHFLLRLVLPRSLRKLPWAHVQFSYFIGVLLFSYFICLENNFDAEHSYFEVHATMRREINIHSSAH